MNQSHTPDSSRLPKLGEWRPMDINSPWKNGDQILVAVPTCSAARRGEWRYEYYALTVKCDEHFFALECDNRPWNWELEDADFFTMLSGSLEPQEPTRDAGGKDW